MIRILVVDDSSVVRRAVLTALSNDPVLKVVATASDGQDAIEQLRRHPADIVITDLEMPRMDGLGLIAYLTQNYPHVPVLVLASAANPSRSTVAALAAGAVDYVTKPAGSNAGASVDAVAAALVPKIKLHASRRLGKRLSGVSSAPNEQDSLEAPAYTGPLKLREKLQTHNIDAVGVAVSTGGPQALTKFVAALPADLGVPMLIVQHMPAAFTKLLAERLDTQCVLPVREAAGGEVIGGKGELWIAPGGLHMLAERRGPRIQLALSDAAPEQSCKPAADVLLRSMAQVWGGNVLAVVMTGMGADGTAGTRHVIDAGGAAIAQDEPTSVVWGMPGSVARNGLVDSVLPLERLGREVVARVRQSRLR